MSGSPRVAHFYPGFYPDLKKKLRPISGDISKSVLPSLRVEGRNHIPG